MQLTELIKPQLIRCRIEGISKKRVFNQIAVTLSEHIANSHADEIFDGLIQRERLGSTGIGEGVAIPHCRLSTCQEMVAALITLSEPIEFDTIDAKKVDLLCVLIAPTQSQQLHLDTLAAVAELFSDSELPNQLRDCATQHSLYDTLVTFYNQQSPTPQPLAPSTRQQATA